MATLHSRLQTSPYIVSIPASLFETMWTSPVLIIIVCSWSLTESRESLRDQLAMLRQEQWRDKERIEALERKVCDIWKQVLITDLRQFHANLAFKGSGA